MFVWVVGVEEVGRTVEVSGLLLAPRLDNMSPVRHEGAALAPWPA